MTERRTAPQRTSLGEIALLFLKLGTIAFGGPAAHVAMMEDEVVRRRRWLTREQFLDYLGATNLIPGPNSTELAIHVGHARAGWPGLLVAGACFILPAALIVGAIAWAYVRFGTLPAAQSVLYGVKPVVIAVVFQALWGLGRSAVKSAWLAVLGALAVAAVAVGVNELLVLAGAAVVMAAGALVTRKRATPDATRDAASIVALAPLARTDTVVASGAVAGGTVAAATAAAAPVALWPLFAVFLKIGAVLFGSGYVLLAFLRADLVTRLHWLTERQLLDAVAVGQVTPGPVFTTATFVGYLLGRAPGAAVATLGIFLPAFVFVAISGPLVPRMRRSRVAGAVLDGVNVASLALMAVVTWALARAALVDALTWALAALAAVALIRFRVNSAWLVIGGAFIGLAVGGGR
ncbi:MAG TPA: chromate efflux transporter [Gemmatimonadaceae bacterium]|nr:chromate efflux transporter [Gemmatimonadaceae bacterium]